MSDQFWDTVGRNLPLETQMAVRPHPVLDAVYIEVSFGERRIEHLFAVPTEDDLPLAPAVGQRLTALLNASA